MWPALCSQASRAADAERLLDEVFDVSEDRKTEAFLGGRQVRVALWGEDRVTGCDCGWLAAEYRQAHGLGRRGPVVTATTEVIPENARRTMSARPAFVQARDPVATSAAQRRGPAAISPAGLEAIRSTNRSRRGSQRLGITVTCEE